MGIVPTLPLVLFLQHKFLLLETLRSSITYRINSNLLAWPRKALERMILNKDLGASSARWLKGGDPQRIIRQWGQE